MIENVTVGLSVVHQLFHHSFYYCRYLAALSSFTSIQLDSTFNSVSNCSVGSFRAARLNIQTEEFRLLKNSKTGEFKIIINISSVICIFPIAVGFLRLSYR